jgi:hypothetical protein
MKTPRAATPSDVLNNGGFDATYSAAADDDGNVVCLARGEVRAMAGAQTADIRGVAGRAWVTQEGDAADVIVAAGDEFHAAPRGKIVVQALADDGAVLRVTRRHRHAAARAPRPPTARGRRA